MESESSAEIEEEEEEIEDYEFEDEEEEDEEEEEEEEEINWNLTFSEQSIINLVSTLEGKCLMLAMLVFVHINDGNVMMHIHVNKFTLNMEILFYDIESYFDICVFFLTNWLVPAF